MSFEMIPYFSTYLSISLSVYLLFCDEHQWVFNGVAWIFRLCALNSPNIIRKIDKYRRILRYWKYLQQNNRTQNKHIKSVIFNGQTN